MISLRNTRARRHGSSGQALAEVAIALPILLLMLVGIFEFARAYQIQQVVVNAAREGARQAVLQGVNSDSATVIVNTYLAGGSITGATIVITDTNNTGDPTTVQVSVPYSFGLIGPIIRLATSDAGRTGPGDITLSSQATMRHE
ncbi:MAG: pilus assembly protein [Gemmatimonadales bacterium]|nr:MAG: pilus assembly protein [Gemmatimonadales bacterium]